MLTHIKSVPLKTTQLQILGVAGTHYFSTKSFHRVILLVQYLPRTYIQMENTGVHIMSITGFVVIQFFFFFFLLKRK